MNTWNQDYHKLLQKLITEGYNHYDTSRKTNTKAIFGHQIKVDLEKNFPAITTKKMAWKSVVSELLWFLRGETNIKALVDDNNPIWDKDAYNYYLKSINSMDGRLQGDGLVFELDEDEGTYRPFTIEEFIDNIKNNKLNPPNGEYRLGDLGPIYGQQWRRWEKPIYDNYDQYNKSYIRVEDIEEIDQIKNIIDGIKKYPDDRGHILNAWNVADLKDMGLRPCHMFAQFNVRGEYLDCNFYLRSNDTFLGLPFNIATYALLTHIISIFTFKKPGNLTYMGGNVHLYEDHIPMADEQLERDVNMYDQPQLRVNEYLYMLAHVYDSGLQTLDEIFEALKIEDFTLDNYKSYPSLKAEMLAKTS